MTEPFPIGTRPEPTPPSGPDRGVELAETRLALLQELETSLAATAKALLERDLAALDQGTREQMCLRRQLEILLAPAAEQTRANDQVNAIPQQHSDPRLAAELRAAAMRVLHLIRVQSALLVRAERSLRMISNLAAGPDRGYGPGLATAFPQRLAIPGDPPCRV